jgi:uncharacterized integral membrane protein
MSPDTQRASESPRVVYRGSGFYVSLVVILLISVALLIFAVQNTREVAMEFLGFDFSIPLFAVVIGAGLVTAVLDQLIGLVWRRQRRHRLAERRELNELRAEVAAVSATAPAGEGAEGDHDRDEAKHAPGAAGSEESAR